MIFDHVSFGVESFARSRAFYLATLAPLNIGVLQEGKDWAIFGRDGEGALAIGDHNTAPSPIHIAFAAASIEEVEAFYAAGIAAGAKDNGLPGLRPQYHSGYYAAFLIDPDGHNIEAVFHGA